MRGNASSSGLSGINPGLASRVGDARFHARPDRKTRTHNNKAAPGRQRRHRMRLKDLPLASKLYGAMGLLILAMLVIGGGTLVRNDQIISQATASINDAQDIIRKSVQWQGMTQTAVARSMASAISSDPAVGELFKENIANDAPEVAKLREGIAKQAERPEDKAKLKEIVGLGQTLLAASKKARDAGEAGDWTATSRIVKSEYVPSVKAYLDAIGQFVVMQEQRADAARQASLDARAALRWQAGFAALVIAGLGIATAWLLSRAIALPMAQAVQVAEAVAAGDLRSDIDQDARDETGQLLTALKRMNESLMRIVGQVRQSSDSIATGTGEIASGNADLSQRTEQQAANLQQTAASMEELTATVKQNADIARTATQLAQSASEVAVSGGQAVQEVVAVMRQIDESSRRINDIIGTIDGIAFQTNILALNAAVEAARAGEQGRGFAVVASEVRALAQRSAAAAKEIKSLIGDSGAKVETGSRLAGSAGETMGQIVEQVRRVSDLISEISAASAEQSQGIDQIGDAISQLDQVTQQNAALVEESAAAAESLKHQAAQLNQAVAVFRL
ncbi:MAG: HAMP domain-containing protein [Mitsuaria chitosanitabida]|nr:HAMP domain-containing protein [Roseateles chitosanitabidus]